MKTLAIHPPAKPRVSAKLRQAMRNRIRGGMTIAAACEEAGFSTSGWHKAMGRQAVRDAFAEEQADYISEADLLRVSSRVRALEVALDLMQNAKSETVRARMAEFLLSEGKAPQVAVNIDNRQFTTGRGYAFVPPGADVVEILSPEPTESP